MLAPESTDTLISISLANLIQVGCAIERLSNTAARLSVTATGQPDDVLHVATYVEIWTTYYNLILKVCVANTECGFSALTVRNYISSSPLR